MRIKAIQQIVQGWLDNWPELSERGNGLRINLDELHSGLKINIAVVHEDLPFKSSPNSLSNIQKFFNDGEQTVYFNGCFQLSQEKSLTHLKRRSEHTLKPGNLAVASSPFSRNPGRIQSAGNAAAYTCQSTQKGPGTRVPGPFLAGMGCRIEQSGCACPNPCQ
ncbi:hypothetical protein [Labrenzia sp. OB1]|uniref:hypothetical protein n=1 Tax=Labrenzia sp. OB1 TaxID=1561204 RepID=UPI001FCC9816|nr:hypothetical protein [Labrenzia sp. OB1]